MWAGVPARKEHLGLPRLPNWIVHSDKADLHNLVVSFTASHGPSDEWHPQKIIFLLGCNKSYVKCSTACKAMEEMWQKKTLFLFYSSSISLFLFYHSQCLWTHRDMRPTRGPCGFATDSVVIYRTILDIYLHSYPRFMYVWEIFTFVYNKCTFRTVCRFW